MTPKDRDNKLQKRWVIYKFKCPHINCPEEYIGESRRTFRDRLKEHLRVPSTTITTPQDIQSSLNVLPLSTGNHRESQETSRRLCTSALMTLHSTETLTSINSHTSGARSCKTHQLFNLNKCSFTSYSGATYLLSKYSYVGVPSFHPTILYTSLHTPNTITPQTPYSPTLHFSGTIFGKDTHLFSSLTFLLDWMKWPQYGGCKNLSEINM